MSPSGDSFVGDFTSSRMLHIKRSTLDERIAVAAARQGATFRDNTEVEVRKKKIFSQADKFCSM